MSRILDERDKQKLESNISTTAAVLNKEIENLEEDVQEKDAEIVNTLNAHKNNTSNPHKVTYTQVGADPTGSAAKALSDAKTYTDTKLSALVDSAPETLDTLNELAAALNDDSNFAATMTTELGKKTNNTDFAAHTSNVSNPHKVTASQVGLGNVPNVATNDQTPTYTEASTLAKVSSGEKLSVAFGKISKAITDFIAHLANKANPHSVTKAQVGLGNCDNTSDVNKPVSTAQREAIDLAQTTTQNNLNSHINNKENPHIVTKAQVGLGSVDNTSDTDKPVSTAQKNAISAAKLELQEKLNIHISDLDNPHDVNAYQVGLGNVDNTSDTNKPVSTAQATAIADAKKAGTDAQNTINNHINNKENPHNVTVSQIGADAEGSAAQALTDAKNYTNSKVSTLESKVDLELETNRTLFDDRISMLETRVVAMPTIKDEDEGKVICVVNGAYTLVSIEDLLPNT